MLLWWRWMCLLPRIVRLGDQVPMAGIEAIVDTLEEGENGKYRDDPCLWRRQIWERHWNHLREHAYNLAENNISENHAAHLATRAVMLCEVYCENNKRVNLPQYPE